MTDVNARGSRASQPFDGVGAAKPSLPTTSTDADLLARWRRRDADRLEGGQARAMTHLLERIDVLFEPRWHEAVAGDASVAVGAVLRQRPPPSDGIGLLDVLMTCVLLHAWRGDKASALVLTYFRDRHYPKPPARLA